jgi:hypothetical protein
MIDKEAEAQNVTKEYLLGKYEEEERTIVSDARWEIGLYEQDKERYYHIFTLIKFSYFILKWVKKVFSRILSSHRYEKRLCEAEREVGVLQILIDDEEEQARLDREADERAAAERAAEPDWE